MSNPIPPLPGFSPVSSPIARVVLEKRAAAEAAAEKKFKAPPISYEKALENYKTTAFLAKFFLLFHSEEREALEKDVLKTAGEVRDAAKRERKDTAVESDLKAGENSISSEEFAGYAFGLIKEPIPPDVYDLAQSYGISRDALNLEILKIKVERKNFNNEDLNKILKRLLAGEEVDLTYDLAKSSSIFRSEFNAALGNIPVKINDWFLSAAAVVNDDLQLLLSNSAMIQLEKDKPVKIKIHTENFSAT